MDFGKEENIKYVKNYLIKNKIDGIKNSIEASKKIEDKKYFKENFQKAKEFESKDFSKKFLDAIKLSLEAPNESPFTLNDIKNYIDFRKSAPQINISLIQLFIFVYHFSQEENINKISEKLGLSRNIEYLPTIDYDEDKEHIIIKLERESIRVKVNNPKKIKIRKCKQLFDTLTKSQKHCFIFLICCLISKKTPIIKGPTASGKSYLLNVFSTLLGQEPNLYQMNSNIGMSILTGQEIIKEEFDDFEREKICNAYKNIEEIINYKRSFNTMNLKHYKKIISKIDNKLEESDNLDEETKEKLKKARRSIYAIISPLSRYIHEHSVFIDSICKNEGQWVILDGIEMAPSEILERISPLCGENPEIRIIELGEEIYIESENIKENFHLFMIYNPFNKESKNLNQTLFNKCISFNLPSIDTFQTDISAIIYNSINIPKMANKNIWNILSAKLAASHMTSTKISENHLEQMAGGIKITPRNLIFLIRDMNKNDFDNRNLDETMRWIKSSSLTFYYFNCFIDDQREKKEENTGVYTKDDFKNEMTNSFKKDAKNLKIYSDNYNINEELFPEIVNNLKEIQISSINETSQFNFDFREFVKACLEIPLQQSNLEYIYNQIEETINLLNNSCLSNEFLYSFYQIKIIGKLFKKLLDKIRINKLEQKGLKLNSDDLLNTKDFTDVRPILLKLRLLEGLTNRGKSYFSYGMNPILYMPEINQLINKLNNLVINRNKNSLKELFSFCNKYQCYIKFIEFIFPYNNFIEECKNSDFGLAYYYIELMIECCKNKTNFTVIFDNEEIPFFFEKNQYKKIFPILKLNEKDKIFLSIGTGIKYFDPKTGKMAKVELVIRDENVNKKKTLYFINLLKENSGIVDTNNLKYILTSFNGDSIENISSKKFLISNLFLINNGIIPKIWTFLFSFYDDSDVIDYIINNLLPFERYLFLISKYFFSNLNDKSDIEKSLEFTEKTEKLNIFYNEEIFLLRNFIGKRIEENLTDEEYKNYLNKIDEEISKLEILRDYWPEEKINDYKEILYEIRDKIEDEYLTNYRAVQKPCSNLYIEKEINKAIEKMKNISRTKLKLDEEKKLDKLFSSDELKQLLKEKVKIKNDSNIYKLLESSEFLSSRIFSNISKLNLTEEIPYKNLEINILLDCARTISKTEKFFVMFQVCALTTVFYSLEIPYLISVVGDNDFKVVLKELDEDHSIESLQKTLDCIFIKRSNTNLASCIKTAIDKFKTLDNENSQRVFYMFTNGLDEEFALYEQWKDRIFTNPNHSFAFILSKSKTIKEEQSKYLTEFWDKFGRFCKTNRLPIELIEMSKEKIFIKNENILKINEENLNSYIKSVLNILRRNKVKDNNNKIEKPNFEIKELNNIPSRDNLKNLENILINNSLRGIKDEPYTKKIKMPLIQEPIPELGQNEVKEISKNICSIMKVSNEFNNYDKDEIRTFMKLFKIRKEKINLSILDLIFNSNLPTQAILTDIGTHIDINELIKYFVNPRQNPKIYRELEGGFVKNYGVTVIIDSSISCFSPLSSQHTWSIIQELLSAIGAIDLPCFDLIVSGNPNPFVLCSEKNSLEILSEKSQIWPILFDLLNRKIKNTDLASAIKIAYNLHYLRKADHPDFLFVITDGLYSLSEAKRIVNNVIYCMKKGLNIFGIGVGISPFGIEKLFPNVIYSLNPGKLMKGIATSIFGNFSNNASMKINASEHKVKFNDSNIQDSEKNPLYKKLKNELMNIPVEFDS